MACPLRKEVLRAFKNIHKARTSVFRGDQRALDAARNKINEEYKKNKVVNDNSAVREMIEFSDAVAEELRKRVVQAEESKPGLYQIHITPETEQLDNKPFDPTVEIPKRPRRVKGGKLPPPCCQEVS